MRLKELRTKKKLLQKDVAEMLGVDRTTYAKYESGASEPKRDVLVALAKFFDVPVGYLLGCEEKSSPTTVSDSETALNKELINRLHQLHPKELEKVDAFVQGILASR